MNKRIGRIFKGDKGIWMVFFFLCMVSIVEVFSASSGLTYKSQNYVGPIAYHTLTILAGALVAIITLNIPCRYFKLMTPFLMLISLLTLLWVLLAGTKVGDAGRWISLFGITFQPSEIAKGTVVLAVAQILAAMQREEKGADRNAFKWILWIALPACLLIGLENLSTAAMLFVVVFLMMFFGRVPIRQLGKLATVIIVAATFALTMVWVVGHDVNEEEELQATKTEQIDEPKKEKNFIEKMFHRADTWKSRIKKFGRPAPSPKDYDLDKDAQVAHANIAIVSSGIIGKGPGKSTERDVAGFLRLHLCYHHRGAGYFRSLWCHVPLYHPAVPLCPHCQPLREQFPCIPGYGTGIAAGHSGTVQHDGCCGSGPGHGTASAAHLEGWHIDHYQLRLYRCHPEHQPFSQGEERKRINAKHGIEISRN